MCDSSTFSSEDSQLPIVHRIFLIGFIPKRWHNSSLNAIANDLYEKYFVACNSKPTINSRRLLANAEAVLFFVNEFTLRDDNCLLSLLYAWNMMGYKVSLVYDRLDHGNSMKRMNQRLHNLFNDITDSAQRRSRNSGSSSQPPAFYLSTSHESTTSLPVLTLDATLFAKHEIRERKKKENTKLSLSRSTGNLNHMSEHRTPHPPPTPSPKWHSPARKESRHSRMKLRSPPPPVFSQSSDEGKLETNGNHEKLQAEKWKMSGNEESSARSETPKPERRAHPFSRSTESFASSADHRLSVSCLEDVSNYQKTQYLIFPLSSTNRKPYLIKFPEDKQEEEQREGSVWGSDTSLEEEIKLARTINAGITIDSEEDESRINSPTIAPYIGEL